MTAVIISQALAEGTGSQRLSVKIRTLTPADEAAVGAMMARCSRWTLFRRFHSFSDGAAYVRTLFGNRPDVHTLLAWYGAACIGIGNLAGADLGMLVEDDWQRRGVGSSLVSALLDMARLRGMTRVHADVMGDDQFILRALRRLGPLAVSLQSGTFSVDLDLTGTERSVSSVTSRRPTSPRRDQDAMLDPRPTDNPAGRGNDTAAPGNEDYLDEQEDESFPASDPHSDWAGPPAT
jgi:GNAT superfamily N-acetyltransferase